MYGEIPYNDDECSKCDIRPTVDKTGVLVECYNCTDVSVLMTASPEVCFYMFYSLFVKISSDRTLLRATSYF
jgi:hypothetical protein